MRPIRLLIVACVAVALIGCSSPEERAAAHLETAQKLFDEGDYVKAKLEAQNAAQIEPKNAKVRYLLALIAEKDDQPRAMLQHLLVTIGEDPRMVEARLKLGTLYVYAQAYELAAEQAAAAMEVAPEDPDVQVLNARMLIQQDDIDKGMAALDAALALEPMHVEALGMKALGLHENEPDQALALLDEAIRQLPGDDSEPLRRLKLDILSYHRRTAEVERALLAMIEDAADDDKTYHARLARFYRDQGRTDEAEEMLRSLAADTSDDVGARLSVVQFLAEVREPEVAAETLTTFIEEDPENQQLRLALGDLYHIAERYDDAATTYREAAALDPRSDAGLLARAKLAADRLRTGDTDGAGELLSGILADAPDYPQALLMRAGLLYADQRYDDAIADLRVLLRKEEDNQNGLLLMARSHVASGNRVLATDAYRRLLDLNPDHATATRELVALMLQDNDVDGAAALLARITQDGAGNTDAAILMFEVLVRQGNWQEAEAEARRLAAGEDPNGIGAFLLGQALEARQQYPQAAEAFTQALAKNPYNIQMLQGLARSLNAQGRQAETVAFLRQRTQDNPDHPGLRLMLGGALTERGEVAEALRIFESVVDDYPAMTSAYVAVASLYPDDANERMAAYERGLAAVPGDLTLAGNLAQEYQALGRIDDLIALFEGVLAADPDNAIVANNLAGLLADHRYQDPASLERAVQLADGLTDTDDPLIMDTVGWTYYRGGQNALAVRYLERAVAGNAAIPVVRYHLGMAYLAAGDRIGAKQELKRAIEQANADFNGIEEAREALATLDDA